MVRNGWNKPADINGEYIQNENDEDMAENQEQISIAKCIQMCTDMIELSNNATYLQNKE